MAGTGLFFFAGVQLMPLADTIAITFVYPFIVAVLAPLVLRERLHWREAIAVGAGFGGALLIIRPGGAAFSPVAFLPLGAATCYAFYFLITRSLARAEIPVAHMQFWSAIFACLWVGIAGFAAPKFGLSSLGFSASGGLVLLVLIAMGAIGTLGHWMITHAARHVPASISAGLGYVEIVNATLLGWFIWGDFPHALVWAGIAVVISSGVWLARLQTVK